MGSLPITAGSWQRWGAYAGVASIALGIASGFVGGSPTSADASQAARELAALQVRQQAAAALSVAALPGLMFFMASLSDRLRRHEDAPGALSGLVMAAGAAAAGIVLLGVVFLYAAVLAAVRGDVATTSSLLDLANISGGFSPPWVVLMVPVLAATSIVTLSRGGLPTWLGWASAGLALALGLAAVFSFLLGRFLVSPMAILLVPWFVATAIALGKSEPSPGNASS